jgi:hypothetical protein
MATREELITKVQTETSSSGAAMTLLCQQKLDWIQDDICSRYDFSWLKDYGYINTVLVYTTGTVTVTQDSATVTGDTTVFTDAMVGRLLQVDGEDEWYEISARTSNTEITLSSNYTGISNSALSYSIYKTDYPLATDFKKMIWVKQVITPANMVSIPEAPFNQFFPDIFERGVDEGPDAYVLTGTDSSGYYTIRFTPVQTTRKQIYYCYTKQLATINSTGAISKIPTKWHEAFVFMLDVFVFNMIDIPAKAQIYNNLYEQTIARMIEEDMNRDKSVGFVMGSEKLSGGRIGDVF